MKPTLQMQHPRQLFWPLSTLPNLTGEKLDFGPRVRERQVDFSNLQLWGPGNNQALLGISVVGNYGLTNQPPHRIFLISGKPKSPQCLELTLPQASLTTLTRAP